MFCPQLIFKAHSGFLFVNSKIKGPLGFTVLSNSIFRYIFLLYCISVILELLSTSTKNRVTFIFVKHVQILHSGVRKRMNTHHTSVFYDWYMAHTQTQPLCCFFVPLKKVIMFTVMEVKSVQHMPMPKMRAAIIVAQFQTHFVTIQKQFYS